MGRLRGIASSRNPETYPGPPPALVRDIMTTWRQEAHCFLHGAGQDTVAHWVAHVTRRDHNPRHIRRALIWMVNQGYARYATQDELRAATRCTAFRLLPERMPREIR